MAYSCKLHLKEECDGCGCCMGTLEDDEDDYDPTEQRYLEETWE